jgi:hypothetical protein
MQRAHAVTVSIARAPEAVEEFVRDPRQFPRWLALVNAVRPVADGWLAETADGPLLFRFVPRNGLGVVDHNVRLPDGRELLNAMRVTANGEGCQVVFLAVQRPGAPEAEFQADIAAVTADLERLKALLEAPATPAPPAYR